MNVSRNHRPLVGFFAAAMLFVGSPAEATRPDRPLLPLMFTSTSGGRISVGNLLQDGSPSGTLAVPFIDCTLFVSESQWVTLSALPIDPDITAYKAKKAFGKQTAHVTMRATFYDGEARVTAYVPVESCSAKWSVKDGDKDLSFISDADTLSADFKCGSDIFAALSLDALQSDAMRATFGEKPRCKIAGKPAPGGCFRGDTVVHTDKGLVAIRDVRVGDRVWSWNEATGNIELAPVLQSIVRPATGLRTVDTGAETFRVTDEHPFWVEDRGWVKAAELGEGDVVRTRTGEALAVRSNRRTEDVAFFAGYDLDFDRRAALRQPLFQLVPASLGRGPALGGVVYNLEVGRNHTFFVGQSATLVHNK
jgi:hypothetical protein